MLISVFIRKIKTVLNDPRSVLIKLMYKLSPIFSDENYLKILFFLRLGKKLNLKHPKTYNEKLQWLKINYRKPIMTKMVDKYEAKEFCKTLINEQHIVKSYGVWSNFDDIDFSLLPDKFVLKTTHDQGGVIIVKDKSSFDVEKARKKINKRLKKNHFYLSREWPYKDVKPRVMAEELLENEEGGDLWDYKFYCFHGKPEIMYIVHGRQADVCYLDFYDMCFNKLDISRRGFPQSELSLEKPAEWELMLSLAKTLSANLAHVRVDFYISNGNVYLGELTFFQGGGLMPFYPKIWDLRLGDFINLEKLKKGLLNEDCQSF